jgi:D-3-phosphoglycerate dehydrogenase
MSPDELKSSIGQYDALIIRSASKVTREIFEAAGGRLKVVGRAGVGVDNVDLTAATEFGCLVVNAPTANTIAAAEHGIALLCALTRNVAQADASVKQSKWERKKYVGVSLVDKTLAIIGFGKVGSEVARRARGLGLTVIAYDPYASEEKARAQGVTLMSLDDCLAKAEFFSLHMPLTPQTKNLFGDEVFGKIKKGARIVNVARGGVIDDAALARALDAGQVAGAALDVFAVEPPPEGHPLVGRPDVICTPHLGASTAEAQEDVSVEVAEVVVSALKGEMAATAVNAPMMPPEVLKELQPYVALAAGLGRTAVQLVAETGFTDVSITYDSPRGDDLDTRLLRAMVIKGILEQVTTATVNLVNADLLAKNRGLTITETTRPSSGKDVLTSLTVKLGAPKARFSAAVEQRSGKIRVAGIVRDNRPFLSEIGDFDVDVTLEGYVLLVRQQDKPGIIAAVSAILGRESVNISFMTVCRTKRGEEAIMAIGVDSRPKSAIKDEIASIDGVIESQLFSEAPLSAAPTH